ncbi:MAG: TatD family hydrolase [bacterium]
MFDTHCHLNFESFEKNLKSVIKRAQQSGISHMVVASTDVKTSEKSISIAKEEKNIYAAIGIHPHHVFKYQTETGKQETESFINMELNKINELVKNKEVVAIGEVGLDRHYYSKTKYQDYEINEKFMFLQKDFLSRQIKIAIKNKKSLILHNREASREFLQLIDEIWSDSLSERTAFHCCEPKKELLEFAKKHKIFIGVDGDVTYNREKEEFVKEIPIELLVLETDSPFLTPEPERLEKKFPNEPKNLNSIAEFISRRIDVSLLDLKKITFENSKKLFNLN